MRISRVNFSCFPCFSSSCQPQPVDSVPCVNYFWRSFSPVCQTALVCKACSFLKWECRVGRLSAACVVFVLYKRYSKACKVTGIFFGILFLEMQINTTNYKDNVIVYKPQPFTGLKCNGAFFFWWYGWPNSPDDVLPQLISGRECACALISLCILSAGVCACIRWAHSASPVWWPCVPLCVWLCVCTRRSGCLASSLALSW